MEAITVKNMEAITDSAEVLERGVLGDVRNRRKTKKDFCRCRSRWKYLFKKSFLYCSQVLWENDRNAGYLMVAGMQKIIKIVERQL